jgi:AcrR family transcriptional regulator
MTAMSRRRTAPPDARKRMSAEERRGEILRAAGEVFARQGFRGASIDDIAREAGISKALIYEHFDGKRDLHVSLLEDHVRDLFERLAAGAATDEPGEVRLRAGIEAFLGFVEERRDGWRMLFRDAAEEDVAEALAGLDEQVTSAVATMIAAEPVSAAEGEEERRQAIAILAQLLTGAMQALANWWAEHPRVPREVLVELAMDFSWLGLERLRAGERWRYPAG